MTYPLDDEIAQDFFALKRAIENKKPNDRSGMDRLFAVLLTDIEKAYAYYETYCREQTISPAERQSRIVREGLAEIIKQARFDDNIVIGNQACRIIDELDKL